MIFLKNNKGLSTVVIVLIVVGVVVVLGGTIGGVYAYNAYQEKKQEEAAIALQKSIDDARNNVVNTYNDRINQIVASLNVEKDGVASIDNNEDVDAMNNAVNELNRVVDDINNDTFITPEQKTILNASVANQIGIINNRINAVKRDRERLIVNPEIEELLHITHGRFVEKYGNEIQQIPYTAMECHYLLPRLGFEIVYPSSGGQKPADNTSPKRIEGKLKNIIKNLDDYMAPEELVNKMSYQGNNDGAYPSFGGIQKGNPSSPYAFESDYAIVNVSVITAQDLDQGWAAKLDIALDNKTIGPDSYTWVTR